MSKGSRESRLEARAVKWARSAGLIVSKLTDPTGIPDRAFWLPGGRPWLVEFKDGTNPTVLQQKYVDMLREVGYEVLVVRSFKEFLGIMKEAGVVSTLSAESVVGKNRKLEGRGKALAASRVPATRPKVPIRAATRRAAARPRNGQNQHHSGRH